MRVEYNKIDEITNRLRQYQIDDKPRYFRLSYIGHHNSEPQPFGADRMSGAEEFKSRINTILNTFDVNKIIVEEFNQKSKNVKKPVHTIEIHIDNDSLPVAIQYPAKGKEETRPDKETNKPEEKETTEQPSIETVLAGIDNVREQISAQVAKEYQLIKEQEDRRNLIAENERLKNENRELHEDNSKLLDTNEELFEQVQKLQKYVPDNFKIGNLSVTKTLGSILGAATETLVKNVVVKKPEKIKALLGETAFEQLAGLMGDEEEETTPKIANPEDEQELQTVQALAPEEEERLKIVQAIHELNNRTSSEQLNKIQLLYYHFLNEDESIDDTKLLQLVRFISKQHIAKEESAGDSIEELPGTVDLD